jgi:hypothetical protein
MGCVRPVRVTDEVTGLAEGVAAPETTTVLAISVLVPVRRSEGGATLGGGGALRSWMVMVLEDVCTGAPPVLIAV